MNQLIKNKLDSLPQKPGVYTFLNGKGKILYIGKAKNLKNRVRSYFVKSNDLTPTKQRMTKLIVDVEYTITDNETEALLLETNLIKEHKPPYNIILKDDKYWQYIVLDYTDTWPQIYTTRRPDFHKKTKIKYFGPYTAGNSVKEIMRQIKKLFPVCLKPPINNQKLKTGDYKPCFNYHLGRCLGPCVGATTPEEYTKIFEDIKKFITGNRKNLIKQLISKMQHYSKTHNFETASIIRDQIKTLKKLQDQQKVVANNHENIDIISLYQKNNKSAINLFKIRHGKLLDKFNTSIKQIDNSEAEIIKSFIGQYYTATTDLPKQIISNFKLPIKKILNIPIKQTLKGKKHQLAKLGTMNAKEYLKQQETIFDPKAKSKNFRSLQMIELKKILNLPHLPKRIETYDISNIQGKLAVGSMVVFENAQAKKSDYRRFKIKLKMTPDDPAMLQEIIERRLKYLKLNRHYKDTLKYKFINKNKTPKPIQDDSFKKKT